MRWPSQFKKGGFLIPAIFITAGFFIFTNVFAYGSKNTHPALTYETGEFYNFNYEKKISNDEIDALMQGAKDEDIPPRWINHFYNPITGEGWTAEGLGNVDAGTVQWFSSFALSPRSPLSAKNWAKNISAQSDYALYDGNQTWQKAIDLYLIGDKINAFKALGHTLHLVQDMTVPDHTRNDTHAGLVGDKGSPYEDWAENYTKGKTKNLQIAENLKQSGAKPMNQPILENYLEINANYSNKNFFSLDTINKFADPNISRVEFISKDNKKLALGFVDNYPAIISTVLSNGSFSNYTTKDPQILSAYWERLSKQAVLSGAGVINLFFKEVAEQEKLGYKPPQTATKKLGVISPFGELVKINNGLAKIFSGAEKLVSQIFPKIGRTETVIDLDDLNNEDSSSASTPPQNDGKKVAQNDSEETRDPSASTPQDDNGEAPVAPRNGTDGVKPDVKEGQTASDSLKQGEQAEENFYVSHVIDGDTVTLNNGKDVRLIGINTPEKDEECFEEGKARLEKLLLGKIIVLQKDTSETDKYGRLLRYIYADGISVNEEMVKSGYAERMTVPPDTKYSDTFKSLEKEAKLAGRGCLNKPNEADEEKNEVGGAPDTETIIDNDFGPYYGGSSWAGNPEHPGHENESVDETDSPTALLTPESATTTPESDASSTSTIESNTSATSTSESEDEISDEEVSDEISQDKILISEIQISGATADDEFIELYNPNNKATSLKSWSVQYRGSGAANFSKKNFLNNATIPAYGFYLIGHKNYSSSGTADMVHSSFSLSSDGGTIFLVRATTTLLTGTEENISDKVAYYKGEKTEAAALFPETQEFDISDLQSGENISGSLERKSNASSTAETMASGGINETDGNAEDSDNNKNDFIIRAAANPQSTAASPEDPTNQHYPPAPEPPEEPEDEDEEIICTTKTYDGHDNSAGTVNSEGLPTLPDLSNTLSATVSPQEKPYYVDYEYVIPENRTLIIEAGTIIKFGKWRHVGACSCEMPIRILVQGNLEINGTKENPVIFTSFRDDTHGAPIETSVTDPAPADWGSLQIDSRAGKNIKIQSAQFYYAGGSRGDGNSAGGAIYINGDAAVSISDTEVLYSQSGIYFRNLYNTGRPEISNSNFSYNQVYGAMTANNGAVKFVSNNFVCNGLSHTASPGGGALLQGGAENITMENNNFLANENYGLYYYPYKTEVLNASNNYWGSLLGPYHKISNSESKGNAVSDYINFSSWASKKF